MDVLEPWRQSQEKSFSDDVKEFVTQAYERERARALPHVVKPLPKKAAVLGFDSPEQLGDHIAYDILTRAPLFVMTGHFSDIKPHAPVRGKHLHISAPTLICIKGKGWEWNDGET